MSALVVQDFLPWTVDFLKSHGWTRSLWDFIFPSEVLEICPTPVHHISLGWGSLDVTWPLVGIFCVIGILGGISLGAKLLVSQIRGSQQKCGHFMWGFTFIWYGLMCLGALFTHCIKTDYHRVFYLIDVIATGCSGISSVGGFLCVWRVIDDTRRIWQIAAISAYSVFSILAVGGTPLIRDQVYIAPTAACFVFLMRQRSNFGRKALSEEVVSSDDLSAKAAKKWLDFAYFGSCLALGSLLADRWMCLILGSHAGCILWVFVGCDIALLSAYKFAVLSCLPAGPGSLKSKPM